MIQAPFAPAAGGAVLAMVAQLAIVAAGLAIMLNIRKLGGRMFLVGLFLAVMAALLPQLLH